MGTARLKDRQQADMIRRANRANMLTLFCQLSSRSSEFYRPCTKHVRWIRLGISHSPQPNVLPVDELNRIETPYVPSSTDLPFDSVCKSAVISSILRAPSPSSRSI